MQLHLLNNINNYIHTTTTLGLSKYSYCNWKLIVINTKSNTNSNLLIDII